MDKLKKYGGTRIFSRLIKMLFGPLDLSFLRDLMTCDTSSEEQGKTKKES